MKPRILVTGGTGFVGKAVIPLLNDAGFDVKLVLRSSAADLSMEGEFETVYTPDLFAENTSWWANVCRDADQVLHLAWIATPGKYLDSEINYNCVRGTLALAQGAVAAGVQHFTGIGTCLEYAPSSKPIPISHPLQPESIYAKCKVSAFESLSQIFSAADLGFAWCRLFHLYGEHESPLRLGGYLQKCLQENVVAQLSDGADVLDFSDVKDVARNIAKVVSKQHQGPVNICSGNAQSVRQFAEGFASRMGKLNLLKFSPRDPNSQPPKFIVGEPTLL